MTTNYTNNHNWLFQHHSLLHTIFQVPNSLQGCYFSLRS